MSKFHGVIGFASATTELSPGIWDYTIVEYPYFGELIKESRRFSGQEKVISDMTIGNSISVLANPYLRENFANMRYVSYAGANWSISEVESNPPRITIRLGGVYNGPTYIPPDDI